VNIKKTKNTAFCARVHQYVVIQKEGFTAVNVVVQDYVLMEDLRIVVKNVVEVLFVNTIKDE